MEFVGKVGSGPVNNSLNFSDDPDRRLDKGLFSGFDTIGRSGKLDCAAITTSLRHRRTISRDW